MDSEKKMTTFQGIKLHKGQERIVKGILNKPVKFNVVNCPRQFGKSTMMEQLTLYYAINNPKSMVLYTAPVHAQSKKVYKEILNGIYKSGIVKSHNGSDQIIELVNGSKIQFSGVEKADNLRGLSVHYMICDEFAFYKSEVWEEVLRPMGLVVGRQVVFVSTPKGKRNQFYTMSMRGQSDDFKNYKYFTSSFEENPYYDREEIEDAKTTLPTHIYRQEYLAEFIDTGMELFTNISEVSNVNKFGDGSGHMYAGLDLGRQDDYTVLTIVDSNNRVVDIYRDRQKPWDTIIGNVIKMLKKYDAKCFVEVNNVGDVIYEMIKKKYSKVYEFVTTNASKQQIIENLIVLFQNKEIQIPTEDLFKPLHDEIQTFTYEYNPRSRTIKYTHLNGHHDDTIDSLALATACVKRKRNVGVPIQF